MQQGLKGSIAGVVAAATLLAGGILTVPHAMALEADGQYYSSKQPYVAPSEATTASYSQAPEGYETVYTESMARHGSRGLSSYKYDALLMKMAEAAEADNGFKSDAIKSEFMKNLKAITAANVENGYGMLTGQGADQHQGIGARAYTPLVRMLYNEQEIAFRSECTPIADGSTWYKLTELKSCLASDHQTLGDDAHLTDDSTTQPGTGPNTGEGTSTTPNNNGAGTHQPSNTQANGTENELSRTGVAVTGVAGIMMLLALAGISLNLWKVRR